MLPALLLAFAMFAAACGDDDDDDGDANGDTPTATEAAGENGDDANGDDANGDDANGDDANGDDDGGDANGGNVGGGDAGYVAGLCNAFGGFETGFNEAFAEMFSFDPDATEEEQEEFAREVFSELAAVLSDFADEIDQLDPPSDIEEYHNQMVTTFREVGERIESDDFDFMSEEDPFEDLGDIEEPPADVTAKYEELAAQVPECQGLDLFAPDPAE